MFGSKPGPATPSVNDRPQRYEYLAESYVGEKAFNKGVNALARIGWEVVSISFNGMAYHTCLKREVGPHGG